MSNRRSCHRTARSLRRGPSPASHPQAGFSLLEVMVALAISTTLLIAVLNLLDLNSRIGRVQTGLSEVQQNQRVVQNFLGGAIRMAGRGGLGAPLAFDLPADYSSNADDNVAASYQVAGNDVVEGTDVLRVRMVESVFVVENDDTSFDYDSDANAGTVLVNSLMPSGIAQQPLDSIEYAVDNSLPVALIIVSRRNPEVYAVVELGGGSSVGSFDVNGDGTTEDWEKQATLEFSSSDTTGTHNITYLAMSSGGAWPDTMDSAATVGILNETAYYVREAAGAATGSRPQLAQAQLFPGTDVVVGDAGNGRIPIADDVVDLQVEYGLDLDGDRQIDENDDDTVDEWLYNADGEDVSNGTWGGARLAMIAITSVIQTPLTDPQYMSPALDAVANRVYGEDDSPTGDALIERRHRRRIQRSVFESRNL